MRKVRVYSESPLSPNTEVVLQGDAYQHIARVLRMREGDDVTLFDGSGCDFPGRVATIDKKSARVTLAKPQEVHSESPLQLTLWHALCRGDRMDLVVQKATELGVHNIQPVLTERGMVRLDASRSNKRLLHWHKIIVSAAEQSGRSRLPELRAPLELGAALTGAGDGAEKLLLDAAGSPLSSIRRSGRGELVLFSGPEGGLTPSEKELAGQHGFVSVSLGPRTLRTETAPIVALGIAQSLWGDASA